MSTWNTEETLESAQDSRDMIYVDSREYDVTNIDSFDLVAKIASIAKENGIQKFDVKDANNTNVDADEIENEEFQFPLRIVRINTAA